MKHEDVKFVERVAEALRTKREENIDRASHTVSFGDEQFTEVSLTLSRDDIRKNTGRQKVRDVVIDELADAFAKNDGLKVTRLDSDTLSITTVPVATQSSFTSVNQLLGAAEAARRFLTEEND